MAIFYAAGVDGASEPAKLTGWHLHSTFQRLSVMCSNPSPVHRLRAVELLPRPRELLNNEMSDDEFEAKWDGVRGENRGTRRWRGAPLPRVRQSAGGSKIFSAPSGNMLVCQDFPFQRNSAVGMAQAIKGQNGIENPYDIFMPAANASGSLQIVLSQMHRGDTHVDLPSYTAPTQLR